MAQATLSVRIDHEDKKYFEEFCNNAGLNVSVAINMFVKAVIRTQRIPFEIEADPFYSERNLKRLRKSIAEVEAGHSTVHELVEVD